jgi:AraC-like DNA-binding protein
MDGTVAVAVGCCRPCAGSGAARFRRTPTDRPGRRGSERIERRTSALTLRAATVAAVKRHIERHLQSPALCVKELAASFGTSRASLYRLFETEGGLCHYIQQRRLLRAFSLLLSVEHAPRRILDLALDFRFASDATFNRAFRLRFGLPPGEVRNLARVMRNRPEPPALESEWNKTMRWLQALGRAAR